MNKDVRDRLVLPLLIPLGVLAVIAALVIGFSRILLSTSAAAATAVALVAAISVLVVAARVSVSPSLRWGGVAAMVGAVAGVALVAGGFALATVGQPAEEGEEAVAGEAEPQMPVVEISAQNIQFDTDTLTVPAGEAFVIRFANNDAGVPHNVAIYAEDPDENPDAEVLFQGEVFNGVATVDYEVAALEAGSYFFRCDVHPQMKGEVVVEEGVAPAEPPAEEPPAEEPPAEEPAAEGASVTVSAENIAFDTGSISLPADTPVEFTLDNKEPVPHNLSIFPSADGPSGERLFVFEPFPGPGSQTHTIPALPAGTYYFHCDLHPNMSGTVTVG